MLRVEVFFDYRRFTPVVSGQSRAVGVHCTGTLIQTDATFACHVAELLQEVVDVPRRHTAWLKIDHQPTSDVLPRALLALLPHTNEAEVRATLVEVPLALVAIHANGLLHAVAVIEVQKIHRWEHARRCCHSLPPNFELHDAALVAQNLFDHLKPFRGRLARVLNHLLCKLRRASVDGLASSPRKQLNRYAHDLQRIFFIVGAYHRKVQALQPNVRVICLPPFEHTANILTLRLRLVFEGCLRHRHRIKPKERVRHSFVCGSHLRLSCAMTFEVSLAALDLLKSEVRRGDAELVANEVKQLCGCIHGRCRRVDEKHRPIRRVDDRLPVAQPDRVRAVAPDLADRRPRGSLILVVICTLDALVQAVGERYVDGSEKLTEHRAMYTPVNQLIHVERIADLLQRNQLALRLEVHAEYVVALVSRHQRPAILERTLLDLVRALDGVYYLTLVVRKVVRTAEERGKL
mmetsp:Transcript_6787/g.11423  ORF Transcript_6787/g.11423 Transcript_6787/m.11423 type:complete len:462 (-) Transcript_6787:837-2222(-)